MKTVNLHKTFIQIILIAVLGLSTAAESLENPGQLSLAALLIKDGHFDRATKVLAQINEDEKESEPGRFELLKGLLALSESSFDVAITELKEALKVFQTLEKKNPRRIEELRTYLAQAYFAKEDYEKVLRELNQVRLLKDERPKIYLLEANSLWKTNQKEEALNLVSTLSVKFPSTTEFRKLFYGYLIELGLYQYALESILNDSKFEELSSNDMGSLASLFLNVKRQSEARIILEAARLVKGPSDLITKELAGIYVREKKYLAAATLFDELLASDLANAEQASELYRLAGYPVRALTLNTLVADNSHKLKQRLALYIEQKDFERATTLETRLTLGGLLAQEEIRYALAYAYYKVRNFEKTQIHLGRINDEKLFEKATNLRASIEKCQENIWACE